MSFWIKITVNRAGKVTADTFQSTSYGDPEKSTGSREAAESTVSQALRTLAAKMTKKPGV